MCRSRSSTIWRGVRSAWEYSGSASHPAAALELAGAGSAAAAAPPAAGEVCTPRAAARRSSWRRAGEAAAPPPPLVLARAAAAPAPPLRAPCCCSEACAETRTCHTTWRCPLRPPPTASQCWRHASDQQCHQAPSSSPRAHQQACEARGASAPLLCHCDRLLGCLELKVASAVSADRNARQKIARHLGPSCQLWASRQDEFYPSTQHQQAPAAAPPPCNGRLCSAGVAKSLSGWLLLESPTQTRLPRWRPARRGQTNLTPP